MSPIIIENLEKLQEQGISLSLFLELARKCVMNKIDIIQLMNDRLTVQSSNENQNSSESTSTSTPTPTNEIKIETETKPLNDTKNNENENKKDSIPTGFTTKNNENENKKDSIPTEFTQVTRKKKGVQKADKKKPCNPLLLGKIEKFNGFYGEFIVQGTGDKLWFGAHNLLCEIDIRQNCIYECRIGENYDKKTETYRPCATSITIKKKH